MLKLALSVLAITFSTGSIAGLFGPTNYDECILESMKGVTSDVAARAIARSCSEKFSKVQPTDSEVPGSVVSQLVGRGGVDRALSVFHGTIYNGSSDWTISQLTVAIAQKSKEKSAGASHRKREYNVVVSVPPLTNSEFAVSIDSVGAGEIEWDISRARGHRSR